MSVVKDLHREEDLSKELKAAGDTLVLVDFHAQWCGPCKQIAPQLVEFSEEFAMIVLKVDVDEVPELAERGKVQAMPTFHFYRNGVKVDALVGANKDKLRAKITPLTERRHSV